MSTNIAPAAGWTDLNVHRHPALNIYGTKVKNTVRRRTCRLKLNAITDEDFRKALLQANLLKMKNEPLSYREFTATCWKNCILDHFLDQNGDEPKKYDHITNENVNRAIQFFEFGRYGADDQQLYLDAKMEEGTKNKVSYLEFWKFPEPVAFLLLVKPAINGATRYTKKLKEAYITRRKNGDETIPSDAILNRTMTVENLFGFTGKPFIETPIVPKPTVLDIALKEGFQLGVNLSQASNPTTSS